MARITIEDCLENVENMYELVLVATHRSRQLFRGADPMVHCKNKQIVTSLREIAGNHIETLARKDDEHSLDESDLSAIAN